MRHAEIPESVIAEMARVSGPDSAAQNVLAEAAEIRARGGVVRFLFDGETLCVQEGVVMNRADGGKQMLSASESSGCG